MKKILVIGDATVPKNVLPKGTVYLFKSQIKIVANVYNKTFNIIDRKITKRMVDKTINDYNIDEVFYICKSRIKPFFKDIDIPITILPIGFLEFTTDLLDISEDSNPMPLEKSIFFLEDLPTMTALSILDKLSTVEIINKVFGKSFYIDKKKIEVLILVVNYLRRRGVLVSSTETIHTTVYDAALDKNYGPDVATLLENRLNYECIDVIDEIITPTTKQLKLLQGSKVMDIGSELIQDAITNEKLIVIVTDSDADGLTSAAVAHYYFYKYRNYDNFRVLINKRKHGNGVNQWLTDKIIELDNVGLIITADHGSSDSESYKRLKKKIKGVKILVTDHHEFVKPPTDVDVFINPMHKDTGLPEYISGCTVLYALFLKDNNYQSLMPELLQLVAISIISDLMDLSKPLNRLLFKTGLKFIINTPIRPFRFLTRRFLEIDEDVLSFNLINILNASNRLDTPIIGYRFLITEERENSTRLLQELKTINSRKRDLTNEQIDKIYEEDSNVRFIEEEYYILIVLDTSISGLASLVANRFLKDKPVFIITTNNKVYNCSARNPVDTLSLDEVIQTIKMKYPLVIIRGGGHKGAAGITISNVDKFITALNEVVRFERTDSKEYDILHTNTFRHKLIYKVTSILKPFGNRFVKPMYLLRGRVKKANKYTLILTLDKEDVSVAHYDEIELKYGDIVDVYVTLRCTGRNVRIVLESYKVL